MAALKSRSSLQCSNVVIVFNGSNMVLRVSMAQMAPMVPLVPMAPMVPIIPLVSNFPNVQKKNYFLFDSYIVLFHGISIVKAHLYLDCKSSLIICIHCLINILISTEIKFHRTSGPNQAENCARNTIPYSNDADINLHFLSESDIFFFVCITTVRKSLTIIWLVCVHDLLVLLICQ